MDNLGWIFTMAFRDFRRSRGKLILFVSSIVVGIAALVAIHSFGENLRRDIDRQAKELLGADLVLDSNRALDTLAPDTLADAVAQEINFASMVIYEPTGDSRLTQVRALEGDFPFYGTLETTPVESLESFRSGGPKALVERLLLLQFDAEIGDSLRIGARQFIIEGILEKVPGQSGIVSSVAPAVYIPMEYLEETELLQYGSRANYSKYYLVNDPAKIPEWIEQYEADWEETNVGYETVEIRQQSTGRAFSNLSNFLSLVAFIALLLGSVGVGSSVNVFVKEKLQQVAILRCLGVSAGAAFSIFFIQIVGMALVGSALGAVAGTFLQLSLPYVLGDFLPVKVNLAVSWNAIGLGILTGVIISILFSLIPLLKVRKASPMMTLRPETGESEAGSKYSNLWVYGAIVLFIFGFSLVLISDYLIAAGFTAFVLVSFGFLWGAARGMMYVIRRFMPGKLSYPLRQSLANLYRPNNQTINLIATIGLGTAMISTLFFVQTQLLDSVRMADKDDQPNMLLFDIQDDQIDSVRSMLVQEQLPIIQEVPIVTMRLLTINGLDKAANEALDEEDRKSKGLYNREYRNTYRDSLLASESITKGKLYTYAPGDDSLYISVERGFADRAGLDIGDEMVFNVQGRPVTTYIGSLRDIKVNQISTIFLFLFPNGVLEKAPKFHVLITKTPSEAKTAEVQRMVLKEHPNVSVINLATIVDTLEDILGKIGFVVQFMALFSIVTGFLVLISALMISRYQRMRESILLRTLGADSSLVRKINTLEYFFLGSLATLSGIVLSFLATGLLSYFVFEIPFMPAWSAALVLYLVITTLIIFISIWNGRKAMQVPPMEILR